ncbi:MAG: 50S ribosomal protein L31 [Nocardioidaceae bacterium]|nr:50S ribosomal protein L31 [Nocardioidaceae bacterium]
MRSDIHPTYGPVAFRDRATKKVFVTRSTLAGRGVQTIDVDITSDSHPFWTGTTRTLDSEGRVERFQRRYGKG